MNSAFEEFGDTLINLHNVTHIDVETSDKSRDYINIIFHLIGGDVISIASDRDSYEAVLERIKKL